MAKYAARIWDAAEHLETEEDMAVYLGGGRGWIKKVCTRLSHPKAIRSSPQF